jgi:hypothetical protein
MSKSSSNAVAVRRRSGADPTLPAILEFQWPSTAIVNAPIPKSARGTVWVITSLVIVMMTTMGLIPVDQVVTVHGVAISKAARSGVRLYWSWKSRRRVGRPAVPSDVRDLVRTSAATTRCGVRHAFMASC